MSTKIYYGSKFKNSDPAALMESLFKLKALAQKQVLTTLERILGCLGEDGRALFDKGDFDERADSIQKTFESIGHDELSIIVYLRPDKIMATFHGGHNLITKFMLLPECNEILDPHPHWNNTDAPEDLSDEEWEQRAQDWDFLYIPSRDGLSYELVKIDQNGALGLYLDYRAKQREDSNGVES